MSGSEIVRCSACGGDLRALDESIFPIRVCAKCRGGLFPLRKLVAHVQGPHVQRILETTGEGAPVGRRACPTCRRWMRTTTLLNLVSTYELDVCRECDVVWGDPGDLSQAPGTPDGLARSRRSYE